MKKGLIILLVIGALLYFFGKGWYNGLVGVNEDVEEKIGNLQSQYQRRTDLIGNLVATVKNAADYEKETLTKVIEARAKATQITIDSKMLNNPEAMKKFNEVQAGLSSSLGRLLATFERYPDLKAVKGFDELRVSVEGTENRVNNARDEYNGIVKVYNKKVKNFPTNLIAGFFGFNPRSMFKAKEGAENAPDVNKLFDDK